jgi:pimeloyl-ACP methyl ester carboxylesterase
MTNTITAGDDGGPACYFCIRAFSETDLAEDLKTVDVQTLILHGDDGQIVPVNASAMLSSKIIRNAKLVVYEGASHGICTTEKELSMRGTGAHHKDRGPGRDLGWPAVTQPGAQGAVSHCR